MEKDVLIIERTELENWVVNLLKDIQTASEKGENYDLHLEAGAVNEIANLYKGTSWIEIY